jgi:hypothetical protein
MKKTYENYEEYEGVEEEEEDEERNGVKSVMLVFAEVYSIIPVTLETSPNCMSLIPSHLIM